MRAAWILALAALVLAGTARAQLDRRFRTPTDVTDLFQERSGPSELLCLLDFSPGTSAVLWHPYYSTGADYWTHFARPVRTRDYPRSQDPDQDCLYFRYTLSWTGIGGYEMEVRVCWNDSDREFTGAYPFYGMHGPLVAADGAVIDQAYLRARGETLPSGPEARDGSIGAPATWVKYATHVRIHTSGGSGFPSSAYCGAVVALPGGGRTIDLPIPWRLLESPASVPAETYDDPAQGGYPGFTRFVYANRSSLTCPDSGGPGPRRVALDTTGWAGHEPGGRPCPSVGAPGHVDGVEPQASGNLEVEGGRPILYHTDYLFWIFFGTAGTATRKNDAANPSAMTAGGFSSFIIPQVTEPNGKGQPATAWQNGLPARCRYQAVKAALIATYFGRLADGRRVQDVSRWAFRFLDPDGEEAGRTISCSNDLGLGRERSLRSLAHPGDLAALQRKAPGTLNGRGAAVTWAVANALAQFNATAQGGNGASVFDPGHGPGVDDPCGARLLLLVAASGSGWDPGLPPVSRYGGAGGAEPNTPLEGNGAIRAALGQLEPAGGGRFWNPETLVGIAAHGGLEPGLGQAGRFLPFQVEARGGQGFRRRRPVTTLTLGLCLGGGIDAGPPARLNAAALWGDSRVPAAAPFTADPARPGQAPNFSHARHETALGLGLRRAAERAGADADPRVPAVSLVGLCVDRTAYLGVFHPSGGATRWSGDLIMAGLSGNGEAATPVDQAGRPLTAPDPDRAGWAASRILAGYGTVDRREGRVHTLLPGDARLTVVAPGDGTLLRNLQRAMAPASRPTGPGLTRFLWSMLGGDTTRPERKGPGTGSYPMRDRAMGDVINSTPAMLEYAPERADAVPELRAQRDAAAASGARPRFRVLFVATNQGHLHAFGELSYETAIRVDGGQVLVPRAVAVELWSFIPTEAILQPWYLDDVDPLERPNPSPNAHAYLADGAPLVYFNPRPGRAGKPLVRPGDTALLVFGLGKGGRSTYCLEVDDPLKPELHWALRPDEVTGAGNRWVRSMGLATGRPAIARALDGAGRVADFLVLGGGFSSDGIERNPAWTDADPPRPFGRSLILFDLNRGPGNYRDGPGNLFCHSDPAMGSVSAGGVPAEVLPGTGMAQRVYCTDRSGGLWALGLKPASGLPGDSCRVGDWSLRPVLRLRDAVVSTRPEVFTLPQGRIPGTATSALGVVLGTGDRNNPMDRPVPGSGGTRNRLILLFDPGATGHGGAGLDEGLLTRLNWTSVAGNLDPAPFLHLDPGTRKPAVPGFRLDLPGPGGKVVHDPLVTHGALFFSVFTPVDDPGDPCAQRGVTETFQIGRIWHPGAGPSPAGARFSGLAGELVPQADAQVTQCGQEAASSTGDAAAALPAIRRYHGREPAQRLRVLGWRVSPVP